MIYSIQRWTVHFVGYTILSLTMRVCLQSFSRCCLPNLQNHAKFRAVRGRSRSSTLFKVIELDRLDANRKSIICNFLLIINSDCGLSAWSKGRRPPGAVLRSPCEPGWTLAMLLQHDDSTINIVLVLLLLLLSQSCTFFEISTHKAIENSSFSSPPLFDAPAHGKPPEFLNETYAARTGRMGLLYGENCIIFTNRFWLIHPCDRWTNRDNRTDGRAIIIYTKQRGWARSADSVARL